MRRQTLFIMILLVFGFAVTGICGDVYTDLYVDAVNGSNDYFGHSPDEALRTITYALFLYGDYGGPGSSINIHVAPGVYNRELGERFPIKLNRNNVHLFGAGPGESIVNAWSGDPMCNTGTIITVTNASNVRIDGFTLKGGAYGIECVNSNPWINNCKIEGLFYTIGVAIALSGGTSGISCQNSSPWITNCVITNCDGGNYIWFYPLHIVNSSPIVVNCLIVENEDEDIRIFIEGYSHPRFVNCTMANNTGRYGRDETAILILEGSTVKIVNCIFWNNGPESISGNGLVHVSYSNIMGGWDGEGNIDMNPMFVTGPLGDYYLSNADAGQGFYSPCVDAGTELMTFGMDEMTTRTDGVPDSGTVDMGYHYPIEE